MDKTFTLEQIRMVISQVTDEIEDAASLPDVGTIDALNLLTNATMSYLDGTASTLAEVAEQNYSFDDDDGQPLQVILGWIKS